MIKYLFIQEAIHEFVCMEDTCAHAIEGSEVAASNVNCHLRTTLLVAHKCNLLGGTKDDICHGNQVTNQQVSIERLQVFMCVYIYVACGTKT